MASHTSVLGWEYHGQRSLAGYCLQGCKSIEQDLGLNDNQYPNHCFSQKMNQTYDTSCKVNGNYSLRVGG